ncbi:MULTISPECIES: HlyD family efflux transporter periplasmic adaptor subunit [unclassified Cyanobium]|uniref:HlyD family efflux transporter periplasmic adaptor subunit n=1 Tax=unclassified Cyanobium TaxID=2627006 RepID=UPI0020CD3760|nr:MULTISPECIES: HlyD family efflux transporter periplasmic adaptor subunit [unclassified Cyanobium]MCP9777832.1 HlyD family efflux transporter periplasmic adaptor subunit [Cyanobium sp. Tous-M-B4]MCP9876728.1 HlyD family efflux transporter periplasmic adaptor subunit [Cyanobium sp. A2C-AMD]
MAKQSSSSDNTADSFLVELFERTLAWMRGRGGRSASPSPSASVVDQDLVRVRVDLIGNSGEPSALPPPPSLPAAGSVSGGEEYQNPFLPSSLLALQAHKNQGPVGGDWQFNQPVLLRPQKRSSRVLVWTIVCSTGAVVLWAFLAPLGETIAVQGKLQPGSRVKEVQAPVSGVVEAVLVREGDRVAAGQELLRYDLREARSKLAAATAVRGRLESENQIYASALGDRLASGLTANQREQLRSQATELTSRREVALQELRQSEERLRGLRRSYTVSADIAGRYKDLVRSGAASEVQLLQFLDAAEQLRSRIAEEERQLAGLRAQLASSQAVPGADLRGRIEANLRQISQLDDEIRQANLQLQYGQIKAGSSGVVFDLDVSRGSVVDAATPMLKLVPGDALEAKVFVPSKVIGFLEPGQSADLSLDTFPAADYGHLEATVLRIGSDALTPDEMRSALGAEATGLYYPTILRLQRQTLQAGRRLIPLKAGMSLTADIQLRQRPFIAILTGMFSDKRRELERLR